MSKRLIYLLSSIVIVVSTWIVYFSHLQEQAVQKDLERIQSQRDEIDEFFYSSLNEQDDLEKDWEEEKIEEIIEDDKEEQQKNEQEKIQEPETIELDFDVEELWQEVSIEELQDIYEQADEHEDNVRSVFILERIYEKTEDKDVLVSLLDSLAANYMFHDAFDYLDELHWQWKLQDLDMDANSILYIFFNAIPYTLSSLQSLEAIIEQYHENDDISQDDYIFYMSLLNIIYMDFDDFLDNVQNLSDDWKYANFKNDLQIALNQYEAFKDAPEYYKKWLIWFVILQKWYFYVAERVAIEVLKRDSRYILPNQIIAYSNFVLWNSLKSQEYLSKLLNIDNTNSDMYRFFIWITDFWEENYERAITFLSQIDSEEYQKDALRYIVLAYYKTWNKSSMMNAFEKLLEYRPLNDYDLYTFFDIVFYQDSFLDSDFELFNENIRLVARYITACYQDIADFDIWICRYARAWFHFARWDEDIAYRYIKFVADNYPRDYLFKVLWDYYFDKQEYELARQKYLNAILYSTDWDFRKNARDSLVEVIMAQ